MTTKIVCRLLDVNGSLLGWVDVPAIARGDGKLWSGGPVRIFVDKPGTHDCRVLSIHWCDVNVETRVPFEVALDGGSSVYVYDKDTPLIVAGTMPVGLPPVTVGRPVSIGVPVGQLGAAG